MNVISAPGFTYAADRIPGANSIRESTKGDTAIDPTLELSWDMNINDNTSLDLQNQAGEYFNVVRVISPQIISILQLVIFTC